MSVIINLFPHVNINYPSGRKKYCIGTPWRKKAVKKLTRWCYPSMAKTIVASQAGSSAVVFTIARLMKREIHRLCSDEHDTLLCDSIEAVKCFSWETMWLELEKNVPTLMALLKSLLTFPQRKRSLLCFLASALLKQWSPKLALLQRAISVVWEW